MELAEVIAILRKENPGICPGVIRVYADNFCTYAEAAKDIADNGLIVEHPRTGTPTENPYLKIRTAAQAGIKKSRLKTGKLWDAINPEASSRQKTGKEPKA